MNINLDGIKTWLCNALGCCNDFPKIVADYEGKIKDLNFQLVTAQNAYIQLQFNEVADEQKVGALELEISSLNGQIAQLKYQMAQVPKPQIPNPFEQYYNNKVSPVIVKYGGRYDFRTKAQVSTDVRSYYDNPENNADLLDLINNAIGILPSDRNDIKVYKIQVWTCSHITYNFDSFLSKVDEYWQFPYETIELLSGDCEDGAILMANLALAAGVPYWRVRLNAGDVSYGGQTAGHCWMTYCRESDNKFVVIDWCYSPDPTITVPNKPYWKDVSWYKTIWFSFNVKSAYSSGDNEVYDADEIKKFQGTSVSK